MVFGFRRTSDRDNILDVARLFFDTFGADLDMGLLGFFNGTTDEFISLHQYLDVDYYGTTMEERLEVAMGQTRFGRGEGKLSSSLVRVALQRGPIPQAAITYKTGTGYTFLHAFAKVLIWHNDRRTDMQGIILDYYNTQLTHKFDEF